MSKLSMSLFAGAAALVAGVGAAQAAPLMAAAPEVSTGVEQVRMVCNEHGRCWNTRRGRVIVQQGYDSYNYYGGPSYRYRSYDRGPGVSVGVGPGYGYYNSAPGVSVGIGFGGSRW